MFALSDAIRCLSRLKETHTLPDFVLLFVSKSRFVFPSITRPDFFLTTMSIIRLCGVGSRHTSIEQEHTRYTSRRVRRGGAERGDRGPSLVIATHACSSEDPACVHRQEDPHVVPIRGPGATHEKSIVVDRDVCAASAIKPAGPRVVGC